MKKHISMEEATAILASLPASPKGETVPLEEARGRILAEDVCSRFPQPPFAKSPFDGFALSAGDMPGTLPVSDEIPAGRQDIHPLIPGTAVRIFTGAPVPPGADVVIKQEDVCYTNREMTVDFALPAGTNVIPVGEDYSAGALLARAGEHLTPAMLGVLAGQGYHRVTVYRKPRVAVISTGTELSHPGTPRPAYGIYNSSYYTLRGYLEAMGFAVLPPEILPDDPAAITACVRGHMEDADLVITTGGASVGDHDYALATAEALGAESLFWKVNMKPGGAILVSRRGEKLLLGLSGNPAAAVMCLLTVVQPYLRHLTGSNLENQKLTLPLYRDMPKTSSATRLLRGRLRLEEDGCRFETLEGQRNGNILSYHGCNAIGIVPGNTPPLHAGDPIQTLLLPIDLQI